MNNAERTLGYMDGGNFNDAAFIDLSLSWDDEEDSHDGGLDDVTEASGFSSAQDALVKSLNNRGKVDIEYMSKISGLDAHDVISSLGDAIYQNPEKWGGFLNNGWETAEEYLSGNMIRKWRAAKKANEEHVGYFERNIKAIERVLPPAIHNREIYISLGSPWVPAEIIDDFIVHLYQKYVKFRREYLENKLDEDYRRVYGVKHDEITGTWEIPKKTRFRHSIIDTQLYGTKRMETLHILEKTLNMKAIVVTDEVPSFGEKKRRVINQEETVLAIEKQEKLIKEFQDWVWKDDERKKLLWRIFEARYGLVRHRKFDGSFLELPNLSPEISLFQRQKDAVARILFTQNTLLAHEVGAGKTYIMAVAGMELKRIGLSKKNMYVVPNNIVGQWKQIFLKLYPNAKLLVVTPNTFTSKKRKETMAEIRDGEYDGIIIAYSTFEQIALSKREKIDSLTREREEIETAMLSDIRNTKRLSSKLDKIKTELRELKTELRRELKSEQTKEQDKKQTEEQTKEGSLGESGEIFFDELGVTRLFIDEAHNYKNLPLDTKNNMVLGLNPVGSRKCQAMWDKVRFVQTSGGGVIMATGTPITNSVTDAYVMQKYLQFEELRLLDLQHFDSWVGMFAEQRTEFEIDVDTTNYRMATRLSKFHNMPELSALLGQVADFYYNEEDETLPKLDGYTDSLLPKTWEFGEFLKSISERAEGVRNHSVKSKEDNMLKITTDGRKGALDLRLVDASLPFSKDSKVSRCAENVWEIYKETENNRSTQLVFCDTSTPKEGFNLYDELKRLLILKGIPEDEIAFVHDAGTEKKKEELFARVRKGVVRVLIGSTFKLGLGVNVQDKLIALHHLDVPWRPADMVQREGRILRQGNENERVKIFRYITEGSFDAYSWQLLETKQRFITDLLSGTYYKRSGSDIGDTVLNYAEVKALAIGNPLIKKRVELSNELSRVLSLRRMTIDARQALEGELSDIPNKLSALEKRIEDAFDDKNAYEEYKLGEPTPVTTAEKVIASDKRRAIREEIYEAVKGNSFMTDERHLMNYMGFKIILPANMNPKEPKVWLERSGRYYVELSGSDTGSLVRIDNFLENFERFIENLHVQKSELIQKEIDIKGELSSKEDFSDEIARLRDELAKIDLKLGVSF